MNVIKVLLFVTVIITLSSAIISPILLSVSANTSADQNKTTEIRFLNYVEVAIVRRPRPAPYSWITIGDIGGGRSILANITPIYDVLQLNNTCTSCNKHSGSYPVMKINTIINIKKPGSRLRFIKVSSYNSTYNSDSAGAGNYTFFVLEYRSERTGYNVTILTRILTDPENSNNYMLFQTIANIELSGHSIPVIDMVEIINKTSLSEHYEVLAKVFRKLALIEGETRYAWICLAKELRNLAIMVNEYLGGYNRRAYSITLVLDGAWHWLCVLICNVACAVGCGAGTALICAIACSGPCGSCVTIWSCPACIACIVLCGGITGAICYVIGTYGCAPGCDWICTQAGW